MPTLISFVFYAVVFASVAYGLWWVCQKFGMPQPVVWIVGAFLLILLLVFIGNHVGGFPALPRL